MTRFCLLLTVVSHLLSGSHGWTGMNIGHRRSFLKKLGGSVVVISPFVAQADDKVSQEDKEKREKLMRERIAASKQNYRKADNYMSERFKTVDYSCVADTGSPCKDDKDKGSSSGQLEDL